EKVDMLRRHGCRDKYYHMIPGYNSRLDTIQAAVLRVKLEYLQEWNAQRCEKAYLYSELFNSIEGIQTPYQAPYNRHVFNYYTIRLNNGFNNRSELQQSLKSQGIASAVYYPVSLHLQQAYTSCGYRKGDFPESERAQEEVLSLPIYPELRDEQVEQTVQAIKQDVK
ncbi:MAG: DegT/DnrJ/EryC1/StrS family aminotransferase, partial [Chloroflexota bacterium]|nr:DegT/DnrJ/EryC1/StrS family aminotransferase [Chloroflexota bacterium]